MRRPQRRGDEAQAANSTIRTPEETRAHNRGQRRWRLQWKMAGGAAKRAASRNLAHVRNERVSARTRPHSTRPLSAAVRDNGGLCCISLCTTSNPWLSARSMSTFLLLHGLLLTFSSPLDCARDQTGTHAERRTKPLYATLTTAEGGRSNVLGMYLCSLD